MLPCAYENNTNCFDDTRRARGRAESGGDAAEIQLAAKSAAGCPAGRCAGCERGATLARNEINQHPSGIAGAEERQAMNEIILNPTDHPAGTEFIHATNSQMISDVVRPLTTAN